MTPMKFDDIIPALFYLGELEITLTHLYHPSELRFVHRRTATVPYIAFFDERIVKGVKK